MDFITKSELGTVLERLKAWILQNFTTAADYVELPELPDAVAGQTVSDDFHAALNSARSSIANGGIRRLKVPAQTSGGLIVYPALWCTILEIDYMNGGTRMIINFMWGGQFYSLIQGTAQIGQITRWTVSQP